MVLLTGLYLRTHLMSNACVPGTAGTKAVVLGVAAVPCLSKSLASPPVCSGVTVTLHSSLLSDRFQPTCVSYLSGILVALTHCYCVCILGMHVQVRGQLHGLGSVFTFSGFQRSNLGQIPSPAC